uniref:fibronectin type III domain-containing protein n=1 Tax=Paenibacillus psychroresistens TaxID=1778678 RepID=UPI0029CA5DCB|nr:fibronectin type III domain-containing protein [Paenibacillus psychroresistens]
MLKKKTKKALRMRLFSFVFTLSLLLPLIPLPGIAAAATLNVTSYGANGTDANDDTAAIQSVIDAAVSGDTVYFPNGTYTLSTGGLVAKTGVKLLGQSTAGAILKYTSSSDGYILNINDKSNTEVSYLTLWGNNHTIAGIWSENFSTLPGNHNFHHMLLKDFTMTTGFGPFGILTANSNDNKITDNQFNNMGPGSIWGAAIRAGWNSNRTQILRNVIDTTGRGGIYANDGCQDVVVSNNTITRSGLAEHGLSIELHTNCDRGIVEDNNVDHWLSVVRSSYNAVRRNTVHTTDGTVQGMGLEIMSTNSVTTDNLVDGGQQVGIQQSPGEGYQYWGYNTVKNMVMWGMQLQGDGSPTERLQYFYKNKFQNGPNNNPQCAYSGYCGNAIRINGNTTELTFDSNEITGNGNKAIEITGAGIDRLSFINNTITGNAGPSIDQYPSSAADLEWSGNTVSGNGTNTQLTSRGFSNAKPVANFTGGTTISLGQPVTFTNTSTDSNGTIVNNLWDFGEGVPVTTVSPTYTYQKAGTYRVVLVVWDNQHRASIKEQIVVVSSGPPDTTAPSAPTSLASPSKTDVAVNLTWTASTDNVGVTGYNIYKGGVLAGSTSGASSTAFTVTGLTASTAYAFTVKAVDGASNLSAASSTLNVTTNAPDTQAPTTPAGLSSPAKTDTTVSLSWTASTDNFGVTGYEVYKGGVLVGSTIGASATTFMVTGLTTNTTYSFTVKAKDAANNLSAASSALSVTTPTVTYVSDLTWVSATSGWNTTRNNLSIDGNTITLAGVTYPKGIGTHANSDVIYNISNGYSRFVSDIGVDDEVTHANASVIFQVWLDSVKVYDSGLMTANSATKRIDVDVTGKSQLKMTVTDAGVNGSDYDHASWGGAKLTNGTGTPDTIAPSAPTGLSSPSKTSTSVNLSWTASTDNIAVTGYDIYKGGVLDGSTTGATTYTASGLTASTAYSFTVKAKDAAGNNSSASSALSVTTNSSTDTTVPTTPTGLSSPSKTATTVNLSWTASTDNIGVTGYDVYKGGVLTGSTTGATTFTATGLTANTAYSFTVKAKDAAGNNSAASSALSVTTNSAASWVYCAGENNQCSFTGTKDVRYGGNDSYAYGTYTNGVMCSNNTFGDPAPGFYKTCEISDTGGGDTQAPSAPTSLSSPSKTTTTVNLSWTASTDNVAVTGYDIYKGGVLAGSTTGATTFNVTGLTANTAYSFTVNAKDAAGNFSAASSALSVTTNATTDTTAPSAPTSLTSPSKTATTVNLSWTASTDNVAVTGYDIYKGGVLAGSTTGATTFTVTGLTASTAYSFTVNAKDAAGNFSAASSALSVTTNATTDTTAPSAPTSLTSPSKTATTVNLSWTASTDNVAVTGYDIYKGGVLDGSTTGATTYTANGLTASTAYSFTVKAKDAAGNNSAASSALSVTTNASGGTGSIIREYWTGISGGNISNIPTGTTPTGTSTLTSLKTPSNWADSYGTRIRGYIVPTTTGTYTFSVAGDNACELWISTNNSPSNKVLVGYIVDWTNEDAWNTYPIQTSGNISMVAGQSYYIEVLQKEDSGGDHLSVGWTGPGISTRVVVPGTNLAPF